jgi:polyphosphate kinase 2 (PPK2 family)
VRRVSRDLADGYDEELEMEIEDRHPLPGASSAVEAHGEKDYRRIYFQQLFRLQVELVKLQDWVVAPGQKVLILFEGRDAAGKGGAIKRISQKLNRRVCRVTRLRRANSNASAMRGKIPNLTAPSTALCQSASCRITKASTS